MPTEREIEAATEAMLAAPGHNFWLRSSVRPAAKAALEAAERVRGDGWRTMESAPKDGTAILLWSEAWEMTFGITKAMWAGERDGWVAAEFITADWSDEDQPTHWRPLPAPPADQEEGK